MQEFLEKKDDPALEAYRKKLMEDDRTSSQTSSYTNPVGNDMSKEDGTQKIEEFISKQNRVRQRVSLKQRLIDSINAKLKVQVGSNSIYIWKSRRFEEMFFLHVPRFLFLGISCYIIYRISLKQAQADRWKSGVKSLRQEEVSKQIDEISKVIGSTKNTFEPLKNVQYDKSYSGDQYHYSYEREEKDLQEQLFKMYESIEEEEEELED